MVVHIQGRSCANLASNSRETSAARCPAGSAPVASSRCALSRCVSDRLHASAVKLGRSSLSLTAVENCSPCLSSGSASSAAAPPTAPTPVCSASPSDCSSHSSGSPAALLSNRCACSLSTLILGFHIAALLLSYPFRLSRF